MAAVNDTLLQLEAIRGQLAAKDNATKQLVDRNLLLRKGIQDLRDLLNNSTAQKLILEEELGKVKLKMDGLRSNTSRLEGEKQGLEKVLQVRGEFQDKVKRNRKKGDDVADDDDNDSNDNDDDSHDDDEKGGSGERLCCTRQMSSRF